MAHRPPAYRLHRPSGQAVVTLSGKDFYLGPHGSPKSRRRYSRLVDEWETNGRTLPQTIRCNELIVTYMRQHVSTYYRKNGRPTSRQDCIKLALRPVRKLYGREPAADFGPLALQSCREWMIEAGWKRRTINDAVHAIRGMFQWGVEQELVTPDVWQALRAVRGLRTGRSNATESEPVKPVPAAFVDAVQDHVSDQVWAMIRLQLLTGMRPGEVVIMRAVDLDTAGTAWLYRPAEHKTEHHDREREVYLGPRAQAVVKPFLVTDVERFLFSPAEAEMRRRRRQRAARKTPVQPSQRDRRKDDPQRAAGERYTTNSYRRAVHRGIAKANAAIAEENAERPVDRKLLEIPKWSPNQLRHNAATLARREAGLETAQALLGHSDPKVTEIYAEQDRRRAVQFVLRHG